MTEEKEKELTFHEKYCQIVNALDVPKSVKNDFANFNYRTTEGILKAVKVVCIELGFKDIVILTTKQIVFLEGRFYQKAIAKITDGKESYTAEAFAREPEDKPKMDESQVSGSASTYARKYALQDLLMISDEIDPDSLNNDTPTEKSSKPKKQKTPPFKKPTQAQITKINDLTKEYCKIKGMETNEKYKQIKQLAIAKGGAKELATASFENLNSSIKFLEDVLEKSKPTEQGKMFDVAGNPL